jgi:hypothetical protein
MREYDFEREEVARGTLGEELHKIWAKEAARSAEQAEAKSALLERDRDKFVRAVDTIAPVGELRALDSFLQATMSLVDSGLLPTLTRKLVVALREAQADEALLAALADKTALAPQDFLSPVAEPNILGYVTAYPRMQTFVQRATRIVLDNDGFTDEGGFSATETAGVTEIMRELSDLLADVEPGGLLEDSLAIIVRDLLLKPDERFMPAEATRPIWAAVYDTRGYPLATVDEQGRIKPPFVDADLDGLADVDAEGRFVLTGAQTVRVMPFGEGGLVDGFTRDAYGRALMGGDALAFRYVDLNATGLGFLVREYAALSERDVLPNLMAGMRAIMGQTVVQRDERGVYEGFGEDHPLMDLVHGATAMVATDKLPEIMQTTAAFMDRSSGPLAATLVALDRVLEAADRHPEAALHDDQTIAYDLIPVLHEISADPALWRDVMDALADPITARAGDAMITLLSYKNTRATVVFGGPYDACFQQCKASHRIGTEQRFQCIRSCPTGEIFKERMDYSAPESSANRSQLQAIWHLMWGLAGVPYEMKTERVRINGRDYPALPPMVRLPGGAEAFLRAVAGNLDMAEAVSPEFLNADLGPLLSFFGIGSDDIAGVVSLLSQLFGVHLDRKPTHDQLTRMFSQQDIKFASADNSTVLDLAEPMDRDGFRIANNLADGLFEAEASGLIDAVYPLVKAFSDHDREDLLLKLFIVVHDHYSGQQNLYPDNRGGFSPSKAANLRSFEPMMVEIFEEGSLLDALGRLSKAMRALREARGIDMNEALRELVHHATRADGFKTRDGQAFMNLADGRTEMNLTRLHVVFKALGEMSDRLEADPEAEAKWDRAVGDLLDLLLAAKWEAGQEPAFEKPGSVAMTVAATSFLADRARDKRDAGELKRWLEGDVRDMVRDLFTSRLLAGAVVILEQILKVDGNREALDDFMAYVVGTPRGREQVTMAVYQLVVRSTNTRVWVPVARNLSAVLDPDRVWQIEDQGGWAGLPLLSHGALLLNQTIARDPAETGMAIIHRAVNRTGSDPMAAGQLLDVVGDYWRVDPMAAGAFDAADYRVFLGRLTAWLSDGARGLEQLFDLAAMRRK